MTTTVPASQSGLRTLFTHSALLTGRLLRGLLRMPTFLIIGLVQPVIWLLLFGQLFRSVIDLPGFGHAQGGFLQFLTPGVVMMTALFAAAWAGTTYLEDIDRGVMDRMLTSPAHRGALVLSTMAYQAIQTVIQSLIIVAVALLAGARFPGGAAGVVITIVAAVLLALIFASLSNAVALLTRQQGTLIAISQFTTLPLMFLSSAVMDLALAPSWVAAIARYNPVEWAVAAGREALLADTDWAAVWMHLGLLAAGAIVMGLLATRAFRTYRRAA